MCETSIHDVAEQAPCVPHCALQDPFPRCVARRADYPARYLMGVL